MQRLFTYLALALLVFVALATVAANSAPSSPSPIPASSTPLAVVSNASSTDVSLPEAYVPTPSPVPSPSPTPVPKKQQSAPLAAAVPTPTPTLAPTPVSSTALDDSSSALRSALVNILCYAPAGSPLRSITGSGIFIDPKGIILTNAHVAQYFLLADRGVSCTIRTGSPAYDTYLAKPLYVSSAWIHANPTVIITAQPSGTGEYDFGLIGVTKSLVAPKLPDAFPFIPLASAPPSAGAPVVIASYGAQFLTPGQVQSALFPTIVFGSIKDFFTFKVNTVDIIALGGSAAAQEGSSGGGVSDASGSLTATITTSTVEGDTASRSLTAITASYIRAQYASETGSPFDTLLARSVADSVVAFASDARALESILTAQLP